jgi:hypothetical protein
VESPSKKAKAKEPGTVETLSDPTHSQTPPIIPDRFRKGGKVGKAKIIREYLPSIN